MIPPAPLERGEAEGDKRGIYPPTPNSSYRKDWDWRKAEDEGRAAGRRMERIADGEIWTRACFLISVNASLSTFILRSFWNFVFVFRVQYSAALQVHCARLSGPNFIKICLPGRRQLMPLGRHILKKKFGREHSESWCPSP